MRDPLATFYGAYDSTAFHPRARSHIPWLALLVGVAAIALLVLIASDVAAYESRPATLEVTSVSWYAEGGLLTTSAGFKVHSSQPVTLTLLCSTICYRFTGASVSSPFTLVNFAISYTPDQYANVTVETTATAFDGPLTINLAVG